MINIALKLRYYLFLLLDTNMAYRILLFLQ